MSQTAAATTVATYQVEILHNGQSQMIAVRADQKILEAATEAGIDLPSSCNAGVCTTCAAQILTGEVDGSESMGLSPELQKQGFVLLCVSYPRSNLKIQAGCEDRVYELQFGQFQK